MKYFTVFDLATGALKRVVGISSASDDHPRKSLSEGEGCIDGRLDPATHRVDVETRTAVPLSDDDLARNAADQRDRDARARISALEQQQFRPARELALDPANDTARSRLQQLDDAIAEQRLQLMK